MTQARKFVNQSFGALAYRAILPRNSISAVFPALIVMKSQSKPIAFAAFVMICYPKSERFSGEESGVEIISGGTEDG